MPSTHHNGVSTRKQTARNTQQNGTLQQPDHRKKIFFKTIRCVNTLNNLFLKLLSGLSKAALLLSVSNFRDYKMCQMGDNAAQTVSHRRALNRAHALLYKTSYREVACKNHNLETLNQFKILEQSEFGENRVGEGGKRSPTDEVIKRPCSTYVFIFFLLIYVFTVKQPGCAIRL